MSEPIDETKKKKAKGNPWAICTASVGRDDKAKYERCVMKVKKKTGYHESLWPIDPIIEKIAQALDGDETLDE